MELNAQTPFPCYLPLQFLTVWCKLWHLIIRRCCECGARARMFYERGGWRFGCRAAGGPPGQGGEAEGWMGLRGGYVAAAAVVYIRGEGK